MIIIKGDNVKYTCFKKLRNSKHKTELDSLWVELHTTLKKPSVLYFSTFFIFQLISQISI